MNSKWMGKVWPLLRPSCTGCTPPYMTCRKPNYFNRILGFLYAIYRPCNLCKFTVQACEGLWRCHLQLRWSITQEKRSLWSLYGLGLPLDGCDIKTCKNCLRLIPWRKQLVSSSSFQPPSRFTSRGQVNHHVIRKPLHLILWLGTAALQFFHSKDNCLIMYVIHNGKRPTMLSSNTII